MDIHQGSKSSELIEISHFSTFATLPVKEMITK